MRSDPVYVYSTEPHAYLMIDSAKMRLCGCCCEDYGNDWTTFAITPYYQKATRGRDYERRRVELGDLEGKWGILGMIYGNTPATALQPLGNQIIAARKAIYGSPLPPTEINIDSNTQLYGFYSVPIDYRKVGVRGEWSINPINDFGVTVQFGVTDVKQTNTMLVNLDPGSAFDTQIKANTGFTQKQLDASREFVTTESDTRTILEQQGYRLCDFQKTTVEDVHLRLWWRRPFQVNSHRDPNVWPHFFFTPYVVGQVSFDVAHKLGQTDEIGDRVFATPTGNNRHLAVGFIGGFLLDFEETVEFGIEGGMLHFFARNVSNLRIPNIDHEVQSSVFPFSTNVNLKPGRNYFFRATFHAEDFLEHLSANVEYVFVDHSHDEIELLVADPNFFPGQIECRSKWMAQVLLTALNYDISPNIQLGFGVQWPLMQRNSYRTTTVLGTLRCTF